VEWVEVTGRTVDEAKEAALDQLGVDAQEAEFEVLEEPRSGLFGRLRTEARVRARVLPSVPRPKLDRRDRNRRSSRTRQGTESGRGRNRAAPRPAQETSGRARPVPRQVEEKETTMGEGPTLDEEAEAAKEFLVGLLDALDADATVSSRIVEDETIEVAVTGGDLGLLIGPKGQTLAAVQELTRTVVQRRLGGRHGRLLVDVAEYRRKRRVALERFTTEVAGQVLATGTAKVLEPMTPPDRKVVHDTVNDIEGVSTTSEGEEPYRRVAITPDARP
jgi:spoIIIJ-associated protein